ncbi:Multifunctional cyclase-dehydratase-3-O-methyl transferase TcmN [compost metagenome]
MPLKLLAEKTQTHSAALLRLLKALRQFGLVNETDGGFSLTPLGTSLTCNAFASAQPRALLINGEMGQAWRGLAATIRTGQSSFQTQYGTKLFSYFETHPERREIFDRSQDMGLDMEIPELLEHINLRNGETIVDVGGGSGHLLITCWRNGRKAEEYYSICRPAQKLPNNAFMPAEKLIASRL